MAAAQVVPPRPLGADLPVFRPGAPNTGPPDPRPATNLSGQLTLGQVLAAALLQNPELAAYAWEVRAREARILQAGRPPNPVLSGIVEDIGGGSPTSGVESLVQPQATIQMSQVIELGGKRAARQHLAETTRDLAAWDYEMARLDVFTRATRAFVDVLAAQQSVTLASQTLQLVEQTEETVRARVIAGVVSPIEQTKAEVALATARIDSARARRALEAERRRLAVLWGATDAVFDAAAGDLTVLPVVPSFDALLGRLAGNPELARWAAEIAQRQAALELEKTRAVPDVTLSAGYRRFTQIDTNAFVVGGSIPLPLFDKNRGGVQEAAGRAAKAHEEQRAAQARATAALADAYRALSTARDDVSALSAAVLPGARSAFEAISEGYRLGKFGYLDVLDAQRTLVTANAQYLRALSEFHKAAADVERLTGAPLAAPGPSSIK